MRRVRTCSKTGCGGAAVATLTYAYADSTAVVGPLATFAEPHSYDLCEQHAVRLTVPRGWEVLRHVSDFGATLAQTDDLEALANAVREAARVEVALTVPAGADPVGVGSRQGQTGRRGHLRVVPPAG
jgi:Protein of unknown function (DUF3499)